jgi:DNA adenine methylase
MFSCDKCKRTFRLKNHLTLHLKRKIPCDFKNDRIIHQNTHTTSLVLPHSGAGEDILSSDRIITKLSITDIKDNIIIKPILKWVGGKTQILNEIITLFPTEIHNYHEPFLGGGSVLLGLLSFIENGKIKLSGKIYASDINEHLINLYLNIQTKPDELIEEIEKLLKEYKTIQGKEVNRKASTLEEALTSQESYYFWIRSRFNEMIKKDKQEPIVSAMLLFMNKTCFRGVYREGPKGYNVPFGNYKNPSILDKDAIYKVSKLIKDVIFTSKSFTNSFKDIKDSDFVYIDPPYVPESHTSFVSYTKEGFTLEHHKDLFNLCHTLNKKGVKLIMSNSNVDFVKENFPSSLYTTHIISCRRAIHSKEPDTRTNEVLITNY